MDGTVGLRRRQGHKDRERYLRAAKGTMVFGAKTIRVRAPAGRSIYPVASIRGVTVEEGLLLVWLPQEIEIAPVLAIPVRLLSREQQAALAAR